MIHSESHKIMSTYIFVCFVFASTANCTIFIFKIQNVNRKFVLKLIWYSASNDLCCRRWIIHDVFSLNQPISTTTHWKIGYWIWKYIYWKPIMSVITVIGKTIGSLLFSASIFGLWLINLTWKCRIMLAKYISIPNTIVCQCDGNGLERNCREGNKFIWHKIKWHIIWINANQSTYSLYVKYQQSNEAKVKMKEKERRKRKSTQGIFEFNLSLSSLHM